jgi:hypothetical protein
MRRAFREVHGGCRRGDCATLWRQASSEPLSEPLSGTARRTAVGPASRRGPRPPGRARRRREHRAGQVARPLVGAQHRGVRLDVVLGGVVPRERVQRPVVVQVGRFVAGRELPGARGPVAEIPVPAGCEVVADVGGDHPGVVAELFDDHLAGEVVEQRLAFLLGHGQPEAGAEPVPHVEIRAGPFGDGVRRAQAVLFGGQVQLRTVGDRRDTAVEPRGVPRPSGRTARSPSCTRMHTRRRGRPGR